MRKERLDNTTPPFINKNLSLRDLRIADIKKYGLSVRGRREYLKYLNNEKITLRQAVAAHCYDCQGFFADGRAPCPDELCPLWLWSQFRDKEPMKTILITPSDSTSFGSNGTGPDRSIVPKTNRTKKTVVA
jgi:hypothetical protein